MNSIVRPSFKEKFVEIRICKSCEQCTELIGKTQTRFFFFSFSSLFGYQLFLKTKKKKVVK